MLIYIKVLMGFFLVVIGFCISTGVDEPLHNFPWKRALGWFLTVCGTFLMTSTLFGG